MSLIVFDLDGTLIDSRRDLADAANALIVERGGRPLAVEAITAMVGEGAPLLVRRALTAAGLDPDADGTLPRFLELYDERLLAHTRLYDGTREAPGGARARERRSPFSPTNRSGLPNGSSMGWGSPGASGGLLAETRRSDASRIPTGSGTS